MRKNKTEGKSSFFEENLQSEFKWLFLDQFFCADSDGRVRFFSMVVHDCDNAEESIGKTTYFNQDFP